jgi:hypothetical protein
VDRLERFVLDPDGEVVLRHHKVVPLLAGGALGHAAQRLRRWVELYGETLDAFYPVADTEIGRRYRRPRAPARALRTSHRHLR